MEIIMSNIIKRTKGDLKYLFKDSDKLSPKALKRKQRGKRVAAGLVLVLIQLILTILFLFRIITFSILPVQYLLIVNAILILLLLYDFCSQFTKAHILGKILAVIMSCVMLFGFIFMTQLAQTFNLMSGSRPTLWILSYWQMTRPTPCRMPCLILSDITAALTVRLPQKPFQKLNLKIIRH